MLFVQVPKWMRTRTMR